MLLNDTVGDRKPQTGALARGLGSEEGIVDAVQILGCDTVSRVGNLNPRTEPIGPGADFQSSAAAHGVARVEEEIQEYLLQFAGVAIDRRQVGIQDDLHLNAGLMQ